MVGAHLVAMWRQGGRSIGGRHVVREKIGGLNFNIACRFIQKKFIRIKKKKKEEKSVVQQIFQG